MIDPYHLSTLKRRAVFIYSITPNRFSQQHKFVHKLKQKQQQQQQTERREKSMLSNNSFEHEPPNQNSNLSNMHTGPRLMLVLAYSP